MQLLYGRVMKGVGNENGAQQPAQEMESVSLGDVLFHKTNLFLSFLHSLSKTGFDAISRFD